MNDKNKNRMGRGLGEILGNAAIDLSQLRNEKKVEYLNKDLIDSNNKTNSADVMRIPINQIEPNPYQPRLSFDNQALDELAESIKSLGLIQPLTVRRTENNKYQIISGERRYRASCQIGMKEVPAYIRDTNDQGMLEMAIVENIQRADLDPIEVAMSYQRLIQECSLTQEQMADRIGKKRASVANYLRLLKLSAKIQHDIKVGLLSVGHAKLLLSLDNAELQDELCDLIIKEGLSVRALEEKLKRLNKKPKSKEIVSNLPEHCSRLIEHIGKYFNKEISFKRNEKGRGSMTIHFSSDNEINNFLKLLDRINSDETTL